MTIRDFLENVANANLSTEMTDFAKSEITKLDQRNEKRRNTLTKEQIANQELKNQILESLDSVMTAKEVANAFEISTQKASALLGQLAKENLATIIEVKEKGKGKVNGYKKI